MLRKMTADDAQQMHTLDNQIFGSYEAWSLQSCIYELSSPDRYYVGEFEGQNLLAWAGITTYPYEAELLNIAVVPEYRGKNIASKLLQEVIKHSKAIGQNSIFLEVRASNTAAQRLYHKHGFIVRGKRRNYYKNPVEDATIMELNFKKVGVVGAEVTQK